MDVRSKTGDVTASVLHDRGKPPDPLNSSANKPTDLDGSDYLNETMGEEIPTPGTAPIRGIGLRVTNIEGNPLLPRRGMFSTSNVSVLDGLMNISKPVENLFAAGASLSSTSKDDKAGQCHEMPSFANVVQGNKADVKVNFRSLETSEKQDGCDVVLSRESVKVVHDKLANTLYGYFLGDRVAFPVVDYFVRNNWKRYGLQKSMMNANGFFFFKFADQAGMQKVLTEGPWIIRSQPLFLEVWSPSLKLEKKEVKTVQVWVKFHEVPLAAYTEDGLSLIATTIGVPKALDSFTTSMCVDGWGRSSYARALVEISADSELKEELTIAVPCLDGDGFVKEKVYVEYEWCPHRCGRCCVFGHTHENCPLQAPRVSKDKKQQHKGPGYDRKMKQPVQDPGPSKRQSTVDDDGYTTVLGKKAAKKVGFNVNKPKPKFEYRPVSTNRKDNGKSKSESTNVVSRNPFDVLNEVNEEQGQSSKSAGDGNDPSANEEPDGGRPDPAQVNLDDDELVDDFYEADGYEMDGFLRQGTINTKKGASTPSSSVLNESHVEVSNLPKVCKAVFRWWNWTSNGGHCVKGTRIIVGWNPAILDVMVLSETDQVMHLQIILKQSKKMFFCSVIYAANYYISRRDLWKQLSLHKNFVCNEPWVILGDFNSALNLEDKSMGCSSVSLSMKEFQECVDEIEMVDIKRTGIHFTWNQKPKKGIGLMKKIDRVMGNSHFIDKFPSAFADFHPSRLSDHCSCVVSVPDMENRKHRPFKFANFLAYKPDFLPIVEKGWGMSIDGVYQFSVVKKLRLLKSPLRALLYHQGNLHKKVEELRVKLDRIQRDMDNDPSSLMLREEEAITRSDFQTALLDEERFLKQKSKVDWLAAGDMNTAFFHSTLKNRVHYSRIEVIRDVRGNVYTDEMVSGAFVDHYEHFLGCPGNPTFSPTPDLFSKKLERDVARHMVRPVTPDEVKRAMFSMGSDKAPGPDGFTAGFFKNAWPIVGDEVSKAVIDFFATGKLLRELNHTLIVLIPKTSSPSVVTDYRPIACCNVLYKCISKIVADRIKGVLNDIVSVNQSAFVPGRKISDNILLTQELMHNYHRNIGPPKCAFKVDIQKAYDTVDWAFLKNILGKRGLRQGDPISPYLFTLVMEILTAILQQTVRIDSSFKFHNRCERQQIINLCFADDLFIFARGEIASARCIMKALNSFSKMSGLAPNVQKSTVFFSNVPSFVKTAILNIMPFIEGSLPVRYLGVPLISSKLLYKDCQVLVEKLEKRIMHWRNKLLSFAGRLQLITSVLSSLHVYWSSVFILPARVVSSLEALMRNFLWSHDSSFQRGRAKVSWNTVCVPKYEGGLGIRRIGDVNKALISAHIWSILSKRESLWVDWVHSYRLRGKSFWACNTPSSCCWSWRKIIQLRPEMRSFVWAEIGNGLSTSAWFDSWSNIGPLFQFFTPRQIANAGFSLDAKVADLWLNSSWDWPIEWRHRLPALNQIDTRSIQPAKEDKFLWRQGDHLHEFSTARAWDSFRHREVEVEWCRIVWFSQCIPRHAFLMWLIMRRKLLTQDKILSWDISRRKNMNMMCCLLCYANHDSHNHLFFECKFSDQVWHKVRHKAGMELVASKWDDIVNWLVTRSRSKSAGSYVAKLLVAATAYLIWQERNARLFKNELRPPEAIIDLIFQQVRYKLMGAKLKNCENVRRLLGEWGIIGAKLHEDGG
ncbi:uncharacterized protein LOC110931622 [Helianthus annuus]|uniref:uncharacterized protein LOC110931622 n=1 Tax=Helianthus annuus TaxID=4232 RepID=UPI000B908034|nr:uncharacterized protein LOC110931622 [Helianthus annuus]